jgi:hypothetical protein
MLNSISQRTTFKGIYNSDSDTKLNKEEVFGVFNKYLPVVSNDNFQKMTLDKDQLKFELSDGSGEIAFVTNSGKNISYATVNNKKDGESFYIISETNDTNDVKIEIAHLFSKIRNLIKEKSEQIKNK